MAIPTSRTEFKEFCLRQLGKPVIDINVDSTQVDDCVDMALSYYVDYHYDATDKEYYKVQITDQMKIDRYITLPDNIIGAVKVFPIGGSNASSSSNLFDAKYQFLLSDVLAMGTVDLVPLYTSMTHLAEIEALLIGQQPIRFSRHQNRVYIDTNWNKVATGSYLVIEAYKVIDPEVFVDVWKDRWLIKYCTALIKKIWGNNLKKFSGMAMAGGITFNGQVIYDEAEREIETIEQQTIHKWALPVVDMIA